MNDYNDFIGRTGDKFMRNRHFPDQHPMQMIWDIHLLGGTTPGDVGAGKAMETEYVKIWVRGCNGVAVVTQNNYVEPPSISHG